MEDTIMERVKQLPHTLTTDNGIKYITGEFWSAKQRQGHTLHEVPYYACFKSALPKFFIETCSKELDAIYDPFMGRGTTLIEAALHSRIPFGNDINPLCKMLVEPRLLTPRDIVQIDVRLQYIKQYIWVNALRSIDDNDLIHFFHRNTLLNLYGCRRYFTEKEAGDNMEIVDRWIRMVMLIRLTGHSKGFFSRYTMPPNQTVSIASQKKINDKYFGKSEYHTIKDVFSLTERKSKALLRDGNLRSLGFTLLCKHSYDTPEINDESVALTVTSPPFLDVVDYKQQNWIRCWFGNIDIDKVEIAQYRNINDWKAFIGETLKELARITKKGGYIAFEVAEVRKGTIRLDDHVLECAEGLPLKPKYVLINTQDFTKTSNCWNVSNNKKGTNTNRIVVFKKY